MLKNHRVQRFVVAIITVVAISAFAFAARSSSGFGLFAPSEASAESALTSAAAPEPNQPLVIGTCDTAGPVEVEATAGTPGPTAYASLNAAFTAINGGTHQGDINVEVCGNTTETASAILNSGAVAPAAYTSVIIRPVGVTRVIEGAIVGAVIKLNGADNVTIDGRQGGVGTARDLTVRNNSTATATAAVWLASVAAGNGASNNVVRNLEVAAGTDSGNSTNASFGIIMSGTTIGTTANGVENNNNSFVANRIVKARYGILTRGTTGIPNLNPVITDNIVGPTSFGTDQIGKTGIFMQFDSGAIISRNTVQSVGTLVTQSNGFADHCGICIGTESWGVTDTSTATSLNYTVTRNIVRDIIEEKTGSAIGIKLGTTQGGSATGNLVANNFIYNIRANGTLGDQVCGIGISGGNGDSVVNNSISITGDMDPGAVGATSTYGNAIRIPGANAANNANFVVRNNSIYLDASSSSTAANRYYAITLNSAAYVFGTGGLNFNNYYINPANTQLQTGGLSTTGTGNTATTQFATLANWQAALTVPQDANSIQANPLHASPTADLHITGASPNIDAGTTIAAVTVDIDNEARPNGANYDIGADEFYPNPGVLQLSSATYGGNEGTMATVTVNRVMGSSGTVGVTATMTDGSATGGAACGVGVDYVNPGPQVLSFGDTVTTQSFMLQLCTDAVTDAAETFTVTLSAPTGGATLGTPTVATVTIVDIPPPFNGTYTVGTGGNYPSLTNTGGIFEAINLAGATGTVNIEIISDLSGELGTHALNEIAGGIATNIYPCSNPINITGSNASALIRLNGADNVTINGDSNACSPPAAVGGTPATRHLTIQNTNTGTSAVVISVGSNGANGAQNNTIRNVKVLGQDPTTTLIGISMGGATPGTAATGPNNGNRVENCSVRRSIFGIYSAGQAATPNTGTEIVENDLTGTGVDRVRRVGILVFNENSVAIDQNSVAGIDNTGESADAIGIGVGVQSVSTTSTTAGNVSAIVTRNKINGVSNDATFSAAGIAVAGATNATIGAVNLSNNMISGVISDGNAGDLVSGIWVAGVTGSITRLYHNSVSMTGDRSALLTPGTDQEPSYGLAVTGTDPTVEVKDNIFYTTQTTDIVANPNARSYAIGMVTATFVNLDSDYNDFWSTGAQDGGFRTGSLTLAAGTSHVDLAAWNVATGDDPVATSQEVDPVFVDPATDLHLNAMTTPLIGDGITGFATVDHDNDPRPASAPEIGADELVQSAAGSFPAGTFYNAIAAPGDTMAGSVDITNSMTLNGILTTGNLNVLTMGCNASFANAGGGNYVVGTVNKQYCGAGAFVYPVGTTPDNFLTGDLNRQPEGPLPPEYTPVSATVTAGTFPSFLSVKSFDATLVGFDPAQSLSRNWELEELGDITADLTFTYLDGAVTDVNGTEANYIVYRRNSNGTTDPMCLAACVDTGLNVIGPVTGVTQFSRWSGAALVPTAAGVDVSGRVLTPNGAGLRNATVTLTDSRGVTREVRSSTFGNYKFEDVRVGETYVINVNSRRYVFTPRTVQISDSVTGLDMTSDGEQ